MGLFSWLFGNRRKRYPRRRIERLLGPWRACKWHNAIRGTELPRCVPVPGRLVGSKERVCQLAFSEALFPYWLRIDPALAGYLVQPGVRDSLYVERAVPREGKTPRIIAAPEPRLKWVQKRILRRVLSLVPPHPCAHGFVPGRSVFTAAEPHAGQRVVIGMDLRDFFGTITFRRVVGLFRSMEIETKPALMLAGLCCYRGKLPQGAPTSPAISNLVCRRLDARLSGLCRKHGFHYSRYADDLLFSGPSSLVGFLPVLRKIVAAEGFRAAEEKTRVMRSGSRQRVLGLNVNSKVCVPRRVRRLLRAMVHRETREQNRDGRMLAFLQGHAAFMKPAHPEQSARMLRELSRPRWWGRSGGSGRSDRSDGP